MRKMTLDEEKEADALFLDIKLMCEGHSAMALLSVLTSVAGEFLVMIHRGQLEPALADAGEMHRMVREYIPQLVDLYQRHKGETE